MGAEVFHVKKVLKGLAAVGVRGFAPNLQSMKGFASYHAGNRKPATFRPGYALDSAASSFTDGLQSGAEGSKKRLRKWWFYAVLLTGAPIFSSKMGWMNDWDGWKLPADKLAGRVDCWR
jgi:enolase